jgi:glucose-6-phosphate 1-epimerase
MHGLVRTVPWTLMRRARQADGAAHARFRLDEAPGHAGFAHAFACEVDVRALARRLTVSLTATNTGGASFGFTAALHTYLRMRDVRKAVVRGLSARTIATRYCGTTTMWRTPRSFAWTGRWTASTSAFRRCSKLPTACTRSP